MTSNALQPMSNEMLFRILYVSEAARPFVRNELLALHSRARDKNRRLDLTGLLLHKDDRFVQVLEGREPVVKQLFATIQQDSRHRAITLLVEGGIPQREFADWSMGFRELQDSDLLGLYGREKPLGRAFNFDQFKADPMAGLHLLRFIRGLQLTCA